MGTPRTAHYMGPYKNGPTRGRTARGSVYKVKDSTNPQTHAFEVGCEHEPGGEGYIHLTTLFTHAEAYLSADEADTLGQVLQHAATELRANAGRRRRVA